MMDASGSSTESTGEGKGQPLGLSIYDNLWLLRLPKQVIHPSRGSEKHHSALAKTLTARKPA